MCKRFYVATDTGGTFTDLASYDERAGRVVYSKCLTNESDLVAGVMSSMNAAGVSAAEINLFKHGTTLVINTLIQRSGAKTALVTTKGFRDVIEIARGNRPVPFALRYRRDAPLVPRELRFELDERVGAGGQILKTLEESALHGLVLQLRSENVQAIAISFMNAYANPAHEEMAAQFLRAAMPEVYVTTGTALTREWFEYERTSTVIANAYVGARMVPYTKRFAEILAARQFKGTFYMMGSNGGVLSVAQSRDASIALVESGPIGGCIGAAAYANSCNRQKIIAFDMGGTTAKCALVIEGSFDVRSTYYVNGYEHGFPLRTPVVDIVEVGAGGGSIASVDAQKRLSVGPYSAGSTPGPVAFDRGGIEPTVTDANLILGRISSDAFLQGKLRLNVEKARSEMAARIAEPLGYGGAGGIDRAANGVLELSTQVMAGAIKEITIERGHDIRSFSLMAFGGSGPLFGSILARRLRIPEVIVPPHPGNFSTLGMLLADARIDLSRSYLARLSEPAVRAVDDLFAEMERLARVALTTEFETARVHMKRFIDMRYEGQTHAVLVPFERSTRPEHVADLFVDVYRRAYGRTIDGAPCEILGARLAATGEIPKPDLLRLADIRDVRNGARPKCRMVYFPEPVGRIRTPVWSRQHLGIGTQIEGPAVIEEYSATTILMPGDRAGIGPLGEIVIHFG